MAGGRPVQCTTLWQRLNGQRRGCDGCAINVVVNGSAAAAAADAVGRFGLVDAHVGGCRCGGHGCDGRIFGDGIRCGGWRRSRW